MVVRFFFISRKNIIFPRAGQLSGSLWDLRVLGPVRGLKERICVRSGDSFCLICPIHITDGGFSYFSNENIKINNGKHTHAQQKYSVGSPQSVPASPKSPELCIYLQNSLSMFQGRKNDICKEFYRFFATFRFI